MLMLSLNLDWKKWRLLINDFHLLNCFVEMPQWWKGRRSPVCHIRVQTFPIKGIWMLNLDEAALPAAVVVQKDRVGVNLMSLHSGGVCWNNSGSINTPSVGLKKCCYLSGRENEDFIWSVIPDFLCFPVKANSFSSLTLMLFSFIR